MLLTLGKVEVDGKDLAVKGERSKECWWLGIQEQTDLGGIWQAGGILFSAPEMTVSICQLILALKPSRQQEYQTVPREDSTECILQTSQPLGQ